eukprot:RCo040198
MSGVKPSRPPGPWAAFSPLRGIITTVVVLSVALAAQTESSLYIRSEALLEGDVHSGATVVTMLPSIFLEGSSPNSTYYVLAGPSTLRPLGSRVAEASGLKLGSNLFMEVSGRAQGRVLNVIRAEECFAGYNQSVTSSEAELYAQPVLPPGRGFWVDPECLGRLPSALTSAEPLGGCVVFADVSAPRTRVSGLRIGPNVLRWAVGFAGVVVYSEVVVVRREVHDVAAVLPWGEVFCAGVASTPAVCPAAQPLQACLPGLGLGSAPASALWGITLLGLLLVILWAMERTLGTSQLPACPSPENGPIATSSSAATTTTSTTTTTTSSSSSCLDSLCSEGPADSALAVAPAPAPPSEGILRRSAVVNPLESAVAALESRLAAAEKGRPFPDPRVVRAGGGSSATFPGGGLQVHSALRWQHLNGALCAVEQKVEQLCLATPSAGTCTPSAMAVLSASLGKATPHLPPEENLSHPLPSSPPGRPTSPIALPAPLPSLPPPAQQP